MKYFLPKPLKKTLYDCVEFFLYFAELFSQIGQETSLRSGKSGRQAAGQSQPARQAVSRPPQRCTGVLCSGFRKITVLADEGEKVSK